MDRKKSKAIGIVILVVFILGMVALIGYYYFTEKNTVVLFTPSKKTIAERMYNEITERDLDYNYPKSPEEVMEYNIKTIQFMYGGLIVEESLYGEILSYQRKLFSKDILDNNTLEEQTEVVEQAIKALQEQGLSSHSITQLPTIYSQQDPDKCFIRMVQEYNNGQKFYWEYILVKNIAANRWEIARWDLTDENYNKVTDE